MASFNKVVLIGNLTRDIDLKYTPNQTAVASFSLATNRKFKKQDNSMGEEVTYIDCVSFGKPAETLKKYVSKGNPLFVEGRLKLDSWTAQDGSKRNKLSVVVENFQFLSTGNGNGQQASQASETGPGNNDESIPPYNDDIPF